MFKLWCEWCATLILKGKEMIGMLRITSTNSKINLKANLNCNISFYKITKIVQAFSLAKRCEHYFYLSHVMPWLLT